MSGERLDEGGLIFYICCLANSNQENMKNALPKLIARLDLIHARQKVADDKDRALLLKIENAILAEIYAICAKIRLTSTASYQHSARWEASNVWMPYRAAATFRPN